MIGVLLVPTLVTIVWFSVMGGTAIYKTVFDKVNFLQPDGSVDENLVLFQMFETMPGGPVLSGIAIVLVTIFFITSADSGAFVVDMIAHRGDPQPPRATRIFWAVSSGLIAAVLIGLSAAQGGEDTGGMAALQALALVSAFPWSFVMISIVWSMYRALNHEVRMIERLELRVRRRELVDHVTGRVTENVSSQVEEEFAEKWEETTTSSGMERLTDELVDRVYERVATETGQFEAISVNRGIEGNPDDVVVDTRDPGEGPQGGFFDRFRRHH